MQNGGNEMKKNFPNIHFPTSIEEAIKLLEQHPDWKPLAGGTDLFVGYQAGLINFNGLVDLISFSDLYGVSENDDCLIIGALTPHAEYFDHPLVIKYASSLGTAANSIGSPQIRNRGTIGGNICHASPAGDTITPLYALNALLRIQGSKGVREVPIQEIIIGPGEKSLQDGEIVTHILIPKKEALQQIYLSLRQRKSLACNKVSVAFVCQQNEGSLEDVRIALGAVAPTIIRVKKAEQYLENIPIQDVDLNELDKMVCQAAAPINDVRSNKEYRRAMTGVLLRKAFSRLIN